MAWVFLFVAGLFEVQWAVCLKYAQGFTRPWPSVLSILGMVFSVVFLARALKTIPLGTGYAVWTGIGALGTAIAGMILFHEPRAAARLVSMGLIVAGLVGLKLVTK
jgi:quaternary ammonium compound-resistance protein SugE